ncbi:Gls protein (DUF810) [Rhynchospora pubera]|uniref:Gls protein (DUF810) n=1 Tax=Rhynchospora pubera TaxID=906938 RepID=A0AAV8F076_9POAL|nr:Gls protein (DUF810) [Rhynchospora pubera]
MGRRRSGSSVSRSDTEPDSFPDVATVELDCPFGRIETLSRSDLRETAYEIFFMSCRSSPNFNATRSGPMTYHSNSSDSNGEVSPSGGGLIGGVGPKGGTGMNMVNSKIKKVLGLKARRASQPMTRTKSQSSVSSGMVGSVGLVGAAVTANSVPSSPGKGRRPMTSAEIMRQQMRVAELSDARLRKTLMRTMVGQVNKRADVIVLPLELLRQLKSTEFNDVHEYHLWQRRQMKILEAGLILYPFYPLERPNPNVQRINEVSQAVEARPLDMTNKVLEPIRHLQSAVLALAWRNPGGGQGDSCHWADGYPFNMHLYVALLQSIFDHREETVVLDEVDELVELIKRTWPILGINRMIHNVCFAWVLFQQYVITGQVEPDLISATQTMLTEVAMDAKKGERDSCYMKVLSSVMGAMQGWLEKRLMEYHESFERGSVYAMDHILSLALTACKIITEDVPSAASSLTSGLIDTNGLMASVSSTRVDAYIRSSMRSAFTKILENGIDVDHNDGVMGEVEEQDPSTILTQLAKDTEQLAVFEKETYSPLLRRYHPAPHAIAVITLHSCFGVVLKQYLAKVTSLTNELVRVLHSAGRMEKMLIQMVVEDSSETEDGGKAIVKEMVPYDVESIVVGLLKTWIEERLRIGRECLTRAKETESWIPKAKTEPIAQSAVDLMKLAKVTVDEFFEIPVGARDEMVQELADGLGALIQDYTSFVASCGTRKSYIPTLPPLTRCNQDSKFVKLWKRAANPCKNGSGTHQGKSSGNSSDGQNPRPSTSRGTQRLYIRINTLHYIINYLSTLDKSLSFFSSSNTAATTHLPNRRLAPFSHRFEIARNAVHNAIQQVSEVAAYRLIFLDSHNSFYDGLYVGSVENARIRPSLRILKQNLTLLTTLLVDRAQPLAVKEVMKASYEAFLLVLLAGGSERSFTLADHELIQEDIRSLKKAFCTCGEGLVAEETVDREAEVVEGIIELMGHSTERLIEEFSIAACEASGLGGIAVGVNVGTSGQKTSPATVVPMPPTTGKWNRADPNTILRVLCHRNDDVANQFLKRNFQLAKRR